MASLDGLALGAQRDGCLALGATPATASATTAPAAPAAALALIGRALGGITVRRAELDDSCRPR